MLRGSDPINYPLVEAPSWARCASGEANRDSAGAFREESTITSTHVFLAVRKQKVWKAAGCDEINVPRYLPA